MVNGSTKRTAAQPLVLLRDLEGPQSQTAESSTPYRNALTGEVPPLRKTPVLHPPLPAITPDTKIQDCLQLFLQQFLTLLSNHRCAIEPCTATDSETRDIGVQCLTLLGNHRCAIGPYTASETRDIGVQCRIPDNKSVALPEEDTPGEVTVIKGGDPEEIQLHTEASGKRSREVSPTQTTATGPALSRSAMTDAVTLRPSETPTTAKRARVAPDLQPTADLRRTGAAGERRGDGNNLCHPCVRANARARAKKWRRCRYR